MVTYISGFQHTANILADERKVDIPDEIRYLEPDLTPLVHITTKVNKKLAINPEFKMLEKEPHGAWTAVNGAATPGDTTLTVDSSLHIPVGAACKVVGGEMLYVTAKTDATHITVTRSIGPTAAATITDNTPIYTVGNYNEEKGAVPAIIKVKVRGRTNYLQIIREPLGLSRTLQNSELYGGTKREDLRKEASLEWKKKTERAFLFGEPFEDVSGGPTNYPIRGTGGAHYYITETGNVTTTTQLSKTVWATAIRLAFRYGSRTKIALCSPLIIEAIDYWKDGKLNMKPSDDVYGIKVATWETGNGTLLIARDPMLENSSAGDGTGYGGVAMFLDMDNLGYRYLANSDMALYQDVVKDGSDGWTDEILGEVGFHMELPETHYMIEGVTSYT